MRREMVKRGILALAVCAAAGLLTAGAALHFGRITEPYVYPVVPSSEEWADMTFAEQIEACDISPKLLSRMTTPALVETVMDYPFLGDMYLFDSTYMGLKTISERFAGLNELTGREDAMECMEEYIARIGEDDLWRRMLATELRKYIASVG